MKEWQKYEVGEPDKKGRVVQQIYSHDNDHIIYGTECGLQFEGNLDRLDREPEINLRLAQIHALAPSEGHSKLIYRARLAAALSACMAGNISNCKVQLDEIFESLLSRRSAKARLIYLWSAVCLCIISWVTLSIAYFVDAGWEGFIWGQVVCFGATGGVLSIALRQQNIPVDPDRGPKMHVSNGASRIVLAGLSGLACYLAIKSGVALTIIEKWDGAYAIWFFCFLSGFSEQFIPNILNNAEKTT